MNPLSKLGIFFTTILLTGCTGAVFFVANYPVDESELNIATDIAYGSEEIQKLDIYSTKNAAEKLPVIVFLYGGGYSDGSKDNYLFMADYFAKLGYVAVLPDYSKYPQVKFPHFVEDSAKAVNWVYDNIDKYNGDNQDITIIGHSAGAHIAALLTFDESYGASDKLTKFIGLSGPYSFTPRKEKYKKIFGPPENYKNMQVDNFVDGNEASTFLLWGDDDKVIGKENLDKLRSAILQKNGKVEVKILQDIDHVDIISAFSSIKQNQNVRDVMADYLKR